MTEKTKDIFITILFVIWFVALLVFPGDIGYWITFIGFASLIIVRFLMRKAHDNLET